MQCRIINNTDREWLRVINNSYADFYHLPCYTNIEGAILSGKGHAYYIRDSNNYILVPFVKRKIQFAVSDENSYDAVSPYGYPGMLYSNNRSLDILELLNKIKKCGEEFGLVSSFIRLNPFNDNIQFESSEDIRFIKIGYTVAVNCEKNLNDIFCEFSTNHKKNIKKLNRLGFKIEVDNWIDFGAFQEIYIETMKRVNAKRYYYLSEQYFNGLRSCLKNNIHLITVKSAEGVIASAGLFSSYNSISHSIFSSTNSLFIKHAPSKLLFYGMIKWCNENNVRLLNLGGGVGAQKDSLYQFKLGFGKEIFPFNGIGIIHDINVYKELESNYSKNTENYNYFPCYRAT